MDEQTLTPDNFALTPEEQEGIDIAAIYESAADPKTKAAVDSIVARFPKLPVRSVFVRRGRRFNSTYAATGGVDRLSVEVGFDYAYEPVTFVCTLYCDGVALPGGVLRWTGGGGVNTEWIGLAFADAHGGIGHTWPPEQLRGDLAVGVVVEYDISKFTRYRNVGIGLVSSVEVRPESFTLADLTPKGKHGQAVKDWKSFYKQTKLRREPSNGIPSRNE